MPIWQIWYVTVTVIWIAIVLLRTFLCPEAGSWPDWMGAFGTVAAFSGTVYLATSEARSRRQEREEVAFVTLLGMQGPLEEGISDLTTIVRFMSDKRGQVVAGMEEPKWKGMMAALGEKVAVLPVFSTEQLKDLLPLAPQAARDIATSQGYWKSLKAMFEAGQILPPDKWIEKFDLAVRVAEKCLKAIDRANSGMIEIAKTKRLVSSR